MFYEKKLDATTGEHTMQELKDIEVGGKLVLDNDDVVTIIHLNTSQIVSQGDAGYYLNSRINGKSTELAEFDIKAKHDPRWWLKDLPDADLFRGNWLACSDSCDNSEWHVWDEEPSEGLTSWVKKPCDNIFCERVTAIKMPTLTGDAWKKSKISIARLKEWQEKTDE